MKTILITGASRGLGKAIAVHYAHKNHVIIMSSNQVRLSEVARELDCFSVATDVSDWSSVELAMQQVYEQYSHIDVLINCAGVYAAGAIDEVDTVEAARVFGVNTLGPLYMAKAVSRDMKARRRGTIININSMGGLSGKSERSVYQGSKWGLTGITKCLELELKPYGVQVTGIYPAALEATMEVKGQAEARDGGIPYSDVIDAIDYAMTRRGALIPTIEIKT
jgi:NAD(P)-dependent dehydrogenase (short-subunit alcohol dehydrogenase family)